ncbi:MAG: DegT/DnrJ/EryC1/StrS family aminotransferase [Syntrophales bacterium]
MESIPHSRPLIGEDEIDAVSAVLRSGQLAQGVQVAAFEKAVASLIGVRGGVAASSGTTALHLSLLALGIGEKDEVVIPGFVCTALLNAVRLVGATPVLADIDRQTYNIDCHDIKRRLTKKTKAIIVPHMFGLSADIREIVALGVPVIEDCAQSLGSSYEGAEAGSFGVLAIFSFYATKVICTGEGGMVTTNDQRLLCKISDLRDYDEKDGRDLRYNYKLTEMQAALGLAQLRRLPGMIARRRKIAARYDEALRKFPITLPFSPDNREHIYYRYVIRTERLSSLLEAGSRKGIGYRRPVFQPLHHCLRKRDLSETDAAFNETLSIPIYPSLGDEEVERVIDNIEQVMR